MFHSALYFARLMAVSTSDSIRTMFRRSSGEAEGFSVAFSVSWTPPLARDAFLRSNRKNSAARGELHIIGQENLQCAIVVSFSRLNIGGLKGITAFVISLIE